MAINLETLILEFELDSSKADKGFDTFVDTAFKAARKIESRGVNPRVNTRGIDAYAKKVENLGKRLDRLAQAQARYNRNSFKAPKISEPKFSIKVNTNLRSSEAELKRYQKTAKQIIKDVHKLFNQPIKPTVNDQQLTGLNEHLSLKQTHYKQVQKDFEKPIKPSVDTQGFSDRYQAVETIAKRRETRESFQPFDRKQLRTDTLGRAASIAAMPFTGVIQGFFENTGRKLNESLSNTLAGIASDLTGSNLQDVFDKKLREGIDTASQLVLGKNAGLSQKPKQIKSSDTTSFDTSVVKLVKSLSSLDLAIQKTVKSVDKPSRVALHRQEFGEAGSQTALKQANASIAYFKSIYNEFKAVQADYKRVEKLLAKFKPDQQIPIELSTRAKQAAKKLGELSNDLRIAGDQAKKAISKTEDPSVFRGQKGQISRAVNLADRNANVAKVRTGSQDFKSIANDTISGLDKGISDKLAHVKKLGQDVGDQLKKGTKDSLDIHSPSREYKEIGKNVNQGLEKGLESSDPLKAYNEKVQKDLDNLKGGFNFTAMKGKEPNPFSFVPMKGKEPNPFSFVPMKGQNADTATTVKGGAIVPVSEASKLVKSGVNGLVKTIAGELVDTIEVLSYEVVSSAIVPYEQGGGLARYGALAKREMEAELIGEIVAATTKGSDIQKNAKNEAGLKAYGAIQKNPGGQASKEAVKEQKQAEKASWRVVDDIKEIREEAERAASVSEQWAKRKASAKNIQKGVNEGLNQLDNLPETVKESVQKVRSRLTTEENAKIDRTIGKVKAGLQPKISEKVVDTSTVSKEFKRGSKEIIDSYNSYVASIRLNSKLAAKAGDKVIQRELPRIQQVTQRLIDSKSAKEDIEALKAIQALLQRIRNEQSKLANARTSEINLAAVMDIKDSVRANLNQASVTLPKGLQKQAKDLLRDLGKAEGIDSNTANAVAKFYSKLRVSADSIKKTISTVESAVSGEKLSHEEILAAIKNLKDLGYVGKELQTLENLLAGIKPTKANKQEAKKLAKNLQSDLKNATEVAVNDAFNSFADAFETAVRKAAKKTKVEPVIQGVTEIPGANARLQDRAKENIRAQEAREQAKQAKSDLERRRAANRARRAQERAEKGLGTDTDIRRFSRQAQATGDRKISQIADVTGGNAEFIKESIDQLLPTILSGSAIMNMMSPIVASIIPAVIPLIPSILVGAGFKQLLTPVYQFAEQSLMRVEPIQQRLGLVASTEKGLKGSGEMDFVKATAGEFGVDLEVAAEGYSSLALAARRTRLEGEGVRDLFQGIAASLGAQKTSAADASLIIQAYSQMISKGKISMEELRQQLGERFPLAMGIFADSLGLSQPAFNELVASGSLLAEDVLPKVGKTLMTEFGQAAKNSANSFIGTVNQLNSAKFEFAENFAQAYGGLPKALKKAETEVYKAINSNFQLFNNAINTGIISVVATIGVASNMLLSKGTVGAVSTKVSRFVREAFTVGMKSVTPFLIVAFADLLDDVFDVGFNPSGKKATFMDNMVDGFTSLFYNPISNLRSLLNAGSGDFVTEPEAVGEVFRRLGQSLANLVPPELEESLRSIGNIIGGYAKQVSGGVVQLAVMYVMFQQLGALSAGLLTPQLIKLGEVLKGYGSTIKTVLATSEGLKTLWNNINLSTGSLWTKNLKDIRVNFDSIKASAKDLGSVIGATFKTGGSILSAFKGELITLGLAYGMLMMSKSELRLPLVEELDKSVVAVRKYTSELKSAMAELRAIKPPEMDIEPNQGFRPMGYQLDPLKLFSDEGYLSDQAEFSRRERIKEGQSNPNPLDMLFRDDTTLFALNQGKRKKLIKDYGSTLAAVGIQSEEFFSKEMTALTRVEKHFLSVAKGVGVFKSAIDAISTEGFTADGAMPQEYQAKVSEIKQIDQELKSLENRRIEQGLLNTDESRVQIGLIDEEIRSTLEKRRSLTLELGFAPQQVENQITQLTAIIEGLNKDTTFPYAERKKLIESYTKELERAKILYSAMEASGLVALLQPPEEAWARLNKELAETVRLFEQASSDQRVQNLNAQAQAIQALINQPANLRDSNTSAIDSARQQLANMVEVMGMSENLLAERQQKLKELLAVPDSEKSEEMRNVITSLKSQINQDAEKVAQMNLDINNQRLNLIKLEEKLAVSQMRALRSRLNATNARAEGQSRRDSLSLDLSVAQSALEDAYKGISNGVTSLVAGFEKAKMTLDTQTESLKTDLSILTESFNATDKQWFLDVIGQPASDFATALNTLTKEELDNARLAVASNLTENPVGDELFNQVSSYVDAIDKVKSSQITLIDSQTRLVKEFKDTEKALDEFNQGIEDRIASLKTSIEQLELDNLGQEIETAILKQLKPGQSGVFKEFASFVTSISQSLISGGKSNLSLAEQSRENAKELAALNSKHNEFKDRLTQSSLALAQLNTNYGKLSNTTQQLVKDLTGLSSAINQTKDVKVSDGIRQPSVESVVDVVQYVEKQETESNGAVDRALETLAKIESVRKSGSSSSLSISDLAYGKGYDPSRFEGYLPGVTPENNTEKWESIHTALNTAKSEIISELDTEPTTDQKAEVALNRQSTSDLITTLGGAMAKEIELKAANQNLTLQNQGLQSLDQAAGVTIGLRKQVEEFNKTLDASRQSINALAKQFNIKDLFVTAQSGLSEGQIAVEDERNKLREFKAALFETLGLVAEGDPLVTKITAQDLNQIDVGSLDLSKLEGFGEFSGAIQEYQAGLISFSDAVIKMAGEADSTNSALFELEAAILGAEAAVKRMADREEEGENLARKADQDANSPFKTDLDRAKSRKASDLFNNETERLKELQKIEESYQRGDISEASRAAKVQITNSYYDKQAKIIKANNSLLKEGADYLKSSLEGFITSASTAIGDLITGNNSADEEKARQEQTLEYANKLEELRQKFQDDPDLFLKAKENLDIINQSKLDNLESEFSTMEKISEAAKKAITDFAGAVLQAAAKIAAQQIAVKIIGSALGGGGFSQGGTVGNFSKGGMVGNYAGGGTITGGLSSMMMGGAIGQAMAKEGGNARLIVAHDGEEIFSNRNGDARFARFLKKSGQWDAMKKSSSIGNFSQGGTVGGGSYAGAIAKSANARPNVTNYSSNTVYNLSGNSNELRMSVNQIEADRQRREKRQYDRNR